MSPIIILYAILFVNGIVLGENVDSDSQDISVDVVKKHVSMRNGKNFGCGRTEDGASVSIEVQSCHYCTPNSSAIFSYKWFSNAYCKPGNGRFSIFVYDGSGSRTTNLTKVHEHKISHEMIGSPNLSTSDQAIILDIPQSVDYEVSGVQVEVKCINKLVACCRYADKFPWSSY